MTEQDILKDYRRQVARAEKESKTELVRKIKTIKQDRNRAQRLIRKEHEVNAKAQKSGIERGDETRGGPGQEGPEQKGSSQEGMGNGQGQGQQEGPEQEPEKGAPQES